MELKEYQQRASDRLDAWLRVLHEERIKSDEEVRALPDSISQDVRDQVADFPKRAWKVLAERHELPDLVLQRRARYTPRTTGSGQPLPHVCLKIPTGGGKTLLGAVAVERILMRTGQQTGLVLWIVPTNAIYAQTKAALWNREHPYRQRLELACGGRVKVLEKDDALSKQDVGNFLCVMLLMFPSTNRGKNRDFLRMFRDAGRYPGFFPEEGNVHDEGKFALQHQSLDRDSDANRVMHSLFNVFKVCEPIVILDEAHKAYGGGKKPKTKATKYAQSISKLDPSIVVELTATPNAKVSNLLVDVTGSELHDEQMIKLPIEVRTPVRGADWQHTLTVARERLEDLAAAAHQFESKSGRYIRPIAVVRADRTGKSQRNGVGAHVEDVRDELINKGVDPNAIRVKSAEVDELRGTNLIDARDRSPVQWILTKDALKEGWDCPFAYVLVLLDKTKSDRAVTQMVGRVMRMPHVEFTGVNKLDRCYVFCHDAEVRHAVEGVRDGLQNEGMGDMSQYVSVDSPETSMSAVRIKRRKRFRGLSIYLPKVMLRTPSGMVRDLDYDRDILSKIEWNGLAIEDPQAILGVAPTSGSVEVGAHGETQNLEDRIEPIGNANWLNYFTHHLSSLVPNAWVCARIVSDAVKNIVSEGSISRSDLLIQRSVYAEEFRRNLFDQVDRRAKAEFEGMFDTGELSFELEASDGNYEIREEYDAVVTVDDGQSKVHPKSIQSSLFKPVLKRDFNEFEREFAFYLDSIEAISWWYRVAATQRAGYYVRGWRRERVFPDFVALATPSGDPREYDRQFMFFETKGRHLADNDDTLYKSCLYSILEAVLNGDMSPSGRVKLEEGRAKGVFRMVIQGQEHKALEGTLAADPS